jgi:hypothetical protein
VRRRRRLRRRVEARRARAVRVHHGGAHAPRFCNQSLKLRIDAAARPDAAKTVARGELRVNNPLL